LCDEEETNETKTTPINLPNSHLLVNHLILVKGIASKRQNIKMGQVPANIDRKAP
jgi:hypothetical protein